MRTIWKLPLTPFEPVMAPRGAKALSVGMQGEDAFLWALVDPDAPEADMGIGVYGTGHDVPPFVGRFVGTLHMEDHGQRLVFHVFQAEDR